MVVILIVIFLLYALNLEATNKALKKYRSE